MNCFDDVEICSLMSESLSESEVTDGEPQWKMRACEGEWLKGSTAGGCRDFRDTTFHQNPQYLITLDEADDGGYCTIEVALMAKGRRLSENHDMHNVNIGFYIYAVTRCDLMYQPLPKKFFQDRKFIDKSSFLHRREVY